MTAFSPSANAQSFNISIGNGANALARTVDAFDHVANAGRGDATAIALLLDKCTAKGDDRAARSIVFLFGQVFPKARITRAKGKATSIKTAGVVPNVMALNLMKGAVVDGLSLHSVKLKALFTPKKDESINPDEEAAKTSDKPLALPSPAMVANRDNSVTETATDATGPQDSRMVDVDIPAATEPAAPKTVEVEEIFADCLTYLTLDQMLDLNALIEAHIAKATDARKAA